MIVKFKPINEEGKQPSTVTVRVADIQWLLENPNVKGGYFVYLRNQQANFGFAVSLADYKRIDQLMKAEQEGATIQ